MLVSEINESHYFYQNLGMCYGNTIKHGALEVLAMECLSLAFFGYMDSIFSNSKKLVIMIVCNILGGNRMGVYYLLKYQN